MIAIDFFIEHFPPHSTAAAIKAKTVADAIVRAYPNVDLRIVTTVEPSGQPSNYAVTGLSRRVAPTDAGLLRRSILETWFGLKSVLRLIRRRPDFAIVSSPSFLFSLPIALISGFLGIPYIMEVRDLYPDAYADAGVMNSRSLTYRVLAGLSRRIFRKSLLIIAATEGIRRRIAVTSNRADILCVYNGYPTCLHGIAEPKYQRFTACFHGGLGYFQDIDTLVAVADQLIHHDIDTIVIGSGRKANLLENVSSIKYLGRMPLEQTLREVARCHVGLSLRVDNSISRDAFPLKVFEYMALGIPSIVTPESEAGSFVTSHRCGVVADSGDTDAIVSAVKRMRDDSDYYNGLASSCRLAAAGLDRESLADDFAKHVGQACGIFTRRFE